MVASKSIDELLTELMMLLRTDKNTLHEQEPEDMPDEDVEGTDMEDTEAENTEAEKAKQVLLQCYKNLLSIKDLLSNTILVGCKRDIYQSVVKALSIHKYVADNIDKLSDKLPKIAKVFKIITEKLILEAQKCLKQKNT